MVHRIIPFPRQHETHRQLVGRARPGLGRRRPRLDAIIVPASRPAGNLDHAVTLARAVGCTLVVLCSKLAQAAQVSELLTARGFGQAVVVDIPDGYEHQMLDFTSSRLMRSQLPPFCKSPNGDLSVKRNLGLLLGRMLGWERVFFMDDDIRDVAPADIFATIAMLGRYRSVGMRVTDFPDNSVVCHAHRETGAAQDIFISGSVLATNCLQATSFFPEIYNEDWLFFYDDAHSRRLGGSGRNATQLKYDPFSQPQRAERQEFGDVLAEGLYALLHLGAGAAAATAEYWKDFLTEREKFLVNISSRVSIAAPGIQDKIMDAVEIARKSLAGITPEMCEDYLNAWQKDLRAWARRLQELPHRDSAETALGEFGLQAAAAHGHPSIDELFGHQAEAADLAERSRAIQIPAPQMPAVAPVATPGECAAS